MLRSLKIYRETKNYFFSAEVVFALTAFWSTAGFLSLVSVFVSGVSLILLAPTKERIATTKARIKLMINPTPKIKLNTKIRIDSTPAAIVKPRADSDFFDANVTIPKINRTKSKIIAITSNVRTPATVPFFSKLELNEVPSLPKTATAIKVQIKLMMLLTLLKKFR